MVPVRRRMTAPMTLGTRLLITGVMAETTRYAAHFANQVRRTRPVLGPITPSTVKWGYFRLGGGGGILWPPNGKMLLTHFTRNTPRLQLPLVFLCCKTLNLRKSRMRINVVIYGIGYKKC